MKKFEYYILLLPCLIFLIWYLPISYYNVFACDDYWHGINVTNYGFWGAQSYYWYNWEGSYTHTFLATIPHILNFIKIPFICNLFSLVFLIFSLVYFFKVYFNFSLKHDIIFSLYIVAFLYTFTIGQAEIRFWVCANITYLFGISTTILFISIYHRFHPFTVKKSIALFILAFLIVGNKLPYIYSLGICIVLHDIVYNEISLKKTGISLLVVLLLSLFNVLAPGNFERLSQNMSESFNYGFSEVLIFRFAEFISFLKWCFLLIPICIIAPFNINKKTLLSCSFAFILFFVGDTVIMYFCFHDPGPIRSYILIEVSCVAYIYLIFNYIFNKFLFYEKFINVIISIICIVVFTFKGFNNIMQIKDSIVFSELSTQRNNMVAHAKEPNIVLEPLPESGLLLSYFCNEDDWLRYVYLPYFNKDNCVIIINEENQKR